MKIWLFAISSFNWFTIEFNNNHNCRSMDSQTQKLRKQLQRVKHQHEMQVSMLQQQIQFYKSELQDFHQKESHNKKLNESIMMTFEKSKFLQQQNNVKSLKMITTKHNEEIKKNKRQNEEKLRKLEEKVRDYKQKCEQKQRQLIKVRIQSERNMSTIKIEFEQRIKRQLKTQQDGYKQVLIEMENRLNKAQNMAQIYKQFMKKREEQQVCLEQNPIRLKSRSQSKKNSIFRSNQQSIDNSYKKIPLGKIQNYMNSTKKSYENLTKNRESLKHLSNRLARAMSQLKSDENSYRLNDLINKKLKQII